MPIRKNAFGKTPNQDINLIQKAMSGDLVMTVSPATLVSVPITGAWTRKVTVKVATAAGETHTWLNKAYATTASIADTSSLGTATIASTTLTLINGMATITVTGSAHAWANAETDTLTIGNITVLGYTVTGGTSVETFTTP